MNAKWKIALATSALTLTVALAGCQSAAPIQSDPQPTAATLASYISIDDARSSALQAADVKENEVEVERVWLSGENDAAQYSVQFKSPEGTLYQYDVNATTGVAVAVEPVDYERQKQAEALEREAEATAAPAASAQPTATATDLPANTQPAATGDIGLDKAKEIALAHAGVKAADATFVETKRDYENGRLVYEVEFIVLSGGSYKEYDYEIAAADGTVVGYDYDIEASYTVPGGNTQPAANGDIGLDKAKEIALNHAGVKAADATFVETKRDYENGRLVYEVEFIVLSGSGYKEYDYEIAVADGTVVGYDYDIEASYTAPGANTQPGTTATGDIGLDKAKEVALAHAGVKAADATFVETKRDYENGRLVYEVEFIVLSGGTYKEYDYEIAAADGTVVGYDYDIEASYTVPGGTQTGTTGSLTEADAKALALAQVPGADASCIYKWKKDYDDGRWVYEGKIVYNTWEYEFEMDAATGAFLEWDMESVFD